MTSYCPTCLALVPSWIKYADGMVYLAKNCPKCGPSHAIIERDLAWVLDQDDLPRTYSQNDCYMVDITGQCNAGCRSCYSKGGEHKDKEAVFAELDGLPCDSRALVSGGEPLQHPDCDTIIRYAATTGLNPVLLTNGAGLTVDRYLKLLDSGLYCVDGIPQIAVSLGLPCTNTTFDAAYDNLHAIRVADIAFSISNLDEIRLIESVAENLRGHYEAICIRTSWDGSTDGLFVSDIVRVLDGDLLPHPTLHGYRNAMVVKNGITYKILSWPTHQQYDVDRYANRGVWYGGDNVVSTLVKRHVASLSL